MSKMIFVCIVTLSACASVPKPAPQTTYYLNDDGELEEVEVKNIKNSLCESIDYWRTEVLVRDRYYKEYVQCDNAREQTIVWTEVRGAQTVLINVTIYKEIGETSVRELNEYDANTLREEPEIRNLAYRIVDLARGIFLKAQKTPCNPPDCKIGENY